MKIKIIFKFPKINFGKSVCSKTFFLISIIILEVNVLIANIIYMKKSNFFNVVREIDNFLINTISTKYSEIAENLSNKFRINNISLINKELYDETTNDTIKTVKIFHRNINIRWIKLIRNDLKGKINIEIDENNPDYLIYATFGCEHILYKFNNTIKIAFFTENQLPDLNFADYAVGLGHINHLDRFFTFPYIVYDMNLRNITSRDIDIIRNNVLKFEKREKFCAALIIDKVKFLKKYKFSIAMENSEADGYASEKIIDSFLAGTIPIYYGDYMVDEYINPKSYILIKNEKDLENKINYIIQIDNDDNLYRKIMKEKVFIDDFFVDNIQNDRKKFLLHIFEQKKEFAKRVDNYHFDFREN